jgi:8-oxo-dGTP pyrophosphatase MutT (NUDIX family)
VIDDTATTAILARLDRELAAPARRYRPLLVGHSVAGWVDDGRAARLLGFPAVFAVNSDMAEFVPALADEQARSHALAGVAATLAAEGALTPWRNELYAVAPSLGANPWFRLERAAARYFGVHTWAAHINGVVEGSPETQMWFARRSSNKAIDPDKLDNVVGGGIAAGMTVDATVAKEAWEEAGIPNDLARHAVRAGAVHIWREQPDGLQSETIFAHDLWLPEAFVPVNQDGEATEHRLVTLDAAARLIALESGSEVVTADASLVVLDFLLRQRAIDPSSRVHDRLAALRNPQAAARRA